MVSPLVAPKNPYKIEPFNPIAAPNSDFLSGQDRLERDQLNRLVYGARVSPIIMLLRVDYSVTTGMFVGTPYLGFSVAGQMKF